MTQSYLGALNYAGSDSLVAYRSPQQRHIFEIINYNYAQLISILFIKLFILNIQIIYRAQMDQRADELLGQVNWHCCKYVGYIIYGDAENNRGGAKGWLSYGSATNKASEATVIVVNGGTHVGYVTDNGKTVYDSPGAGRNKPIRKTDFDTWKGWFNNYVLRK